MQQRRDALDHLKSDESRQHKNPKVADQIKRHVVLLPEVNVKPSPQGRGCPAAGAFTSRSGTGEGSFRTNQDQEYFKWQMAMVKWQMVFQLSKWQIVNHVNFAVCHLPFEFALPFVQRRTEGTPHLSGDS
jgi:hypothetical protein